ncbi:PREDICTED: latent-transforming growth factor beta-binding protein 3-like [Thamnophis sirtalis]|uniref:Latent-transforming growth factor beta-binding protein 3-like n=1 Tax=Thamnophis sirtalis TaxID=35019 RepID=A0A6I9YZQ6_9SAUR|nr:PREDICTED: latent-transforming growth factor beta-binding protein 3-like [Thamnophis sirtalis]
MAGSFRCSCGDGFVPAADFRSCVDVNECQNGSLCTHGVCVNTLGSFKCQCPAGFQAVKDGPRCKGERGKRMNSREFFLRGGEKELLSMRRRLVCQCFPCLGSHRGCD